MQLVSNWANLAYPTDFYHVECIEGILDLPSLHFVARLEPRLKGPRALDHGAQCILEEYISRSRQLENGSEGEEGSSGSDSAGAVKNENSLEEGSREQKAPYRKGPGWLSNLDGPSPSDENAKYAPWARKPKAEPLTLATPTSASVTELDITALPMGTTRSGPRSVLASFQWKSELKRRSLAVSDAVWEPGDRYHEKQRQEEAAERLARDRDLGIPDDDECNPAWDINKYLLPESDPEYDECYALSQALKRWKADYVSGPKMSYLLAFTSSFDITDR